MPGKVFGSWETVRLRQGSAAVIPVGYEEEPALEGATVEELLALPPSQPLARLAECLPLLTAEEVAVLVPQIVVDEKLQDHNPFTSFRSRDAALRLLFTRWAELDAPGMVAALESPDLMYCLQARLTAVNAWVELRGTAALEAIGRKWPGTARAAAGELLLMNRIEAEQLLPFLSGGEGLSNSQWEVLEERLGPERVLQLALNAADGSMVGRLMGDLAASNPARALRTAREFPAGALRDAAQRGALCELQWSEPALFKAEFDTLPPGRLRAELAYKYVEILADGNPASDGEWAAITAWAQNRPPGPERCAATAAAAAALRNADRFEQATKLYHEALPGVSSSPGDGLADAFSRWQGSEPAAAAAWLQTVADVDVRSQLARAIAHDPRRDMALIPSTAARMEFALAVANGEYRVFSETNPKERRNTTAADLPAEWQSIARVQYFQNELITKEVWEAATADERRLLAADAVEGRFYGGTGEPDTALDFFNSLAPEERTLGAWHAAGAAYIVADEAAASEWMRTLPPGAGRDAAATALVEHLTTAGPGRDGEAAFAWAASMSGEVERAYYMESAARAWALEDPAAARAAVSAAPLPEAERTALLQKLPEGGAK